jgi:hypothetical protein
MTRIAVGSSAADRALYWRVLKSGQAARQNRRLAFGGTHFDELSLGRLPGFC